MIKSDNDHLVIKTVAKIEIRLAINIIVKKLIAITYQKKNIYREWYVLLKIEIFVENNTN